MNADNNIFLQEYSSNDAVLKYSKATAGSGISYLLENDYGRIYLEVMQKLLPESTKRDGARVLEFGCGAGMNILHMVSLLERCGIPLREAIGTDFSERLIETATQEAIRDLPAEKKKSVRFLLGRNEELVRDLAAGLIVEEASIHGSFDMIFGVNTIRYCHRLGREKECARGIFELLKRGGVCVVIDMNQKFPLFRSRLRDRMNKNEEEYYLPNLDEYSRPFELAGFSMVRKETFCWVPHSAGPALYRVCKAMEPVLNILFRDRAMRCLIVAQKPL